MKNTEEKKLWAVRPEDGRRFLDEHMIALGGAGLGDLSLLPDSKEAVREKYEAVQSGADTMSKTAGASLYYRLAREVREGDYVAMLWGGEACLGVVEGAYAWTPGAAGCEHQRAVRWDRRLPQDDLPRAALREISASPMALFAVMGDGAQLLSAFDLPPLKAVPKRPAVPAVDGGSTAKPQSAGGAAENAKPGAKSAVKSGTAADRAASGVPEATERRTAWATRNAAPEPVPPLPDHLTAKALSDPRGFLVDEWRRHMDASDLREFTAGLLRAMDYDVELSHSEDGADMAAYRDELTPRLMVLIRYGVLTAADVDRLEASLSPGENGAVVTLTDPSPEVEARLKASPRIRCVDGMELAGLVLKYYGMLDEKFRRKIPLRMGYVPATSEAAE